MLYSYLERLRSEIEAVKKTILDVKIIKSMEDYQARSGYLMGLQRALELFSSSETENNTNKINWDD